MERLHPSSPRCDHTPGAGAMWIAKLRINCTKSARRLYHVILHTIGASQPLSLMSRTEVVIVGAGVAGLAAARRLAALGVDFVVLEAKRRVGGRACTDRTSLGLPFDLGCHWLHSANLNPFSRIASRFGFTAVPNRLNRRIHDGRGWTTDPGRDEWAAFERAQSDRLDEAGASGRDLPADTFLDPTHRWSGLYAAWFGILNGAAPGRVSAVDVSRYRDTGDNRQVREGLGTLVVRYGTGVPVRLGAPARTVRWGGTGVEVAGPAGTLRARAAIVTVSTTALERGSIRFNPRLPPEKIDAIEGLQLGHALRIAIRFPSGTFGDPRNSHEIFADDTSRSLSFQVHPFGRSMATAYAGAEFAAELEGAGLEATRSLVVERLAAMFGSAVSRCAGAAVMSGWAADAEIGGAYSFARPGGGELRARFAAPVGGRLWFAGEAASHRGFSTVHGAWETGRGAADAVAAATGRIAPARLPRPELEGVRGRV